RTGRTPVGYGDVRCMAALSLASGVATPLGAALCYGGAAAFSLAGIAAGKLSWRSGIPMAPFLAAWLVGGACACLHGMG
ncbi:MAG: peptidase A24, partial [Eggerthella lenta]